MSVVQAAILEAQFDGKRSRGQSEATSGALSRSTSPVKKATRSCDEIHDGGDAEGGEEDEREEEKYDHCK